MSDPRPILDQVREMTTLADKSPDVAVDFVATVTDAAWDSKRPDVLEHLVVLVEALDRSKFSGVQLAQLDYYTANTWNGIKFFASGKPYGSWEWESHEIEQETICIRRAANSPALFELPPGRVCQIHTNLANCYNTTGRFVEALAEWGHALAVEPRFGMARGNRGVALWHYAHAVYDQGHAAIMVREAWNALDPASLELLEPNAGDHFEETRKSIEAKVPEEVLTHPLDLESWELGETKEEQTYREWCLHHRLFLNPLNDLGPYSIAARDILTCPSVVTDIGEGPIYHSYFNQIKQEYCSARWVVYQSTLDQPPHFSDRDVLLYNTLDYPSYGLSTEQIKLAFRSVYSLLDKIAFFLNAYMELGIPERQVSLRGLWYIKQKRKRGIADTFKARENWPLRGLYWLSKDFFEDTPGFREAMDPLAEQMRIVRNHLEHKYLKLHSDLWAGPGSSHYPDHLAYSLPRDGFEHMTLHLLFTARAAITYLSLAVHQEERARAADRDPNVLTPPALLDNWEDDWKC